MVINHLRKILDSREITRTAFAILIQRKRQLVYYWCNPVVGLNPQTVDLLCGALHIQPGDLMTYIPDELVSPELRAMRDKENNKKPTVPSGEEAIT